MSDPCASGLAPMLDFKFYGLVVPHPSSWGLAGASNPSYLGLLVRDLRNLDLAPLPDP